MKGTYTTYKSWLTAAKKAGAVRLDGDKDIAMAFDAKNRGVAEWDGAEGYVYKVKSMMDGKMIFENPARRPKESPLYVKYLSLMRGEVPFMMQGTKYEYVWAEYPGGIKDIGVYSYAGDLVYSYDSFRKMMNLDRTNPTSRKNPRHGNDDPSRDEMIEHIRKVYGREADEFDIEEAIYWFATDYHGGQSSNLYSALSTSEYRPGRSSSGPEEGSMGEMIYSDLVDTFSPKKNPVRRRIGISLSKNRKRNPVYDTGSDE